ncbi:FK506-binding protein 2B [Kickxella alabastrina]|uniref:FK506-binding protein 2B n=1 Tax=Kickxella alabastrina TaxID=61397 RepID=A0ACC1I7K5_9FUNG|nr:FK506-binding protein 2B [Kickxella alabastrina]
MSNEVVPQVVSEIVPEAAIESAVEIVPKWTNEDLNSESVSKKDIVSFLQESGNNDFLLAHKLNGKLANIAKTTKRPALLAAYRTLFDTKQFRSSDEVSATEIKSVKAETTESEKPEGKHVQEDSTPKYTKKVTKKGTGTRIPAKGDRVNVFYTGMLENGTQFDTNTVGKGRKPASPLTLKVGTGQVIRGWDEALMTMVQGEKARLTIQPEWAYGQRGNAAGGIPPNATLIFDVELVVVD